MTRTARKRHGQAKAGMLIWCILFTVMVVSLMTFHIWKKVELGHIARRHQGAVKRLALLKEDRVKLVAAIYSRNKPSLILAQAQVELGMVYPNSRLVATGVRYDNGPQ